MQWSQNYFPFHSLLVSALVAAVPVIVLLGLLGLFHVKAHIAALAGLAASLFIAIVVFGMPAKLAGVAAADGAAYGLLPIGWIVLNAIFVYDITLTTGKFEIVKSTIAGLADDRRIQALLIAFCFGAFVEGAAGFGTPVAISAAMLIGLGFKPLPAAGLSLIGNTAPVAFGALGTPVNTLASVTGIPVNTLSAMVGRQLPLFALIVPFWIVWAMAGRKGVREVWPACLVSGLSFAVVQFLVSNFYGTTIVDIVASIVSISSLVVLLQFWQPRSVWKFAHETEPTEEPQPERISPLVTAAVAAKPKAAETPRIATREAIIAWTPWIVLSVVVFAWGLKEVKDWMNHFSYIITVPLLNNAVFRVPPVVTVAKAEAVTFRLDWLSATGTGLLLSGIISGTILGLSPIKLATIFWGTLKRTRYSLLTIAAMLALGYTTRYAGLDATMGLAFASTGLLFPFFSPLLGWLGVALTGSDTSSNILFGNLQQITAQQLGFSPVLAAAANSSGGVMGKMIDAQSIVVAGVATGQSGEEGHILRYVFLHSLVLAALVGIEVMLQAYVFPQIIPK